MTLEAIRSAIATGQPPSDDALRAAVGHVDTLAPAVIALVEKAAEGGELAPHEGELMFYGLPVLAAARYLPLYQPLMRLLRDLPNDTLELLLGDSLIDLVPRTALTVFDGDPGPLVAVLEDRSRNGDLRSALFEVLARLTLQGAVARELAVSLIDRFDRDGLAEDFDPAWDGWQDAILALGLSDMAARVRASWTSDRNPRLDFEQREWEELLSEALAAPDDPARRFEWTVLPIDDPAEAIADYDRAWSEAEDDLAGEDWADDDWADDDWADDETEPFVPAPSPPERWGSKVGRNEPCPCGSGRKYKRCCGK
jgi:hypothetical protein